MADHNTASFPDTWTATYQYPTHTALTRSLCLHRRHKALPEAGPKHTQFPLTKAGS